MVNRKLQLQFLLVLLIGTLILSFQIFKPFLAPLALAIVFSVVLQPVYAYILHRIGKNPSIASMLVVGLSILCLFIPAVLLSTQVFQEAHSLYESLAQNGGGTNTLVIAIQHVGHVLEPYISGAEARSVVISSNVDEYVKLGLSWLVNNFGKALSSASALALDIFLFVVALSLL